MAITPGLGTCRDLRISFLKRDGLFSWPCMLCQFMSYVQVTGNDLCGTRELRPEWSMVHTYSSSFPTRSGLCPQLCLLQHVLSLLCCLSGWVAPCCPCLSASIRSFLLPLPPSFLLPLAGMCLCRFSSAHSLRCPSVPMSIIQTSTGEGSRRCRCRCACRQPLGLRSQLEYRPLL